MNAAPIKFGTDGWRAIIALDFTFDGVRACAQAASEYMQDKGLAGRGVFIGYDTRFASEDFAAAAAEVVAANGIKVELAPRALPTPLVSYSVLGRRKGLGIAITASHNPPQWNGFKLRDEHGASAPPEMLADVEQRIAGIMAGGRVKRLSLEEALAQGRVEYYDPRPEYMKRVSGLVDIEGIKKSRFKIVIDSMYGSGAGYIRELLRGGNLKLVELNSQRNPLFPGMKQPEPIEINLRKLCSYIKRSGADVGVATDGDADRLGLMDEKGNFITQLQTYALLALYFLEVRGERGPIIKTLTTTSMLYRLGELYHVPVYETPVGFKYVAPLMLSKGAMLGGEESGGYGFGGHIPERDGILAGLYFLDMMARLGRKPSELIEYLYSKVGPHHYKRLDIAFEAEHREAVLKRVSQAQPQSLAGLKVTGRDTVDGFRFKLEGSFWLLIRFSGTEPLLRIYSEAPSPEQAQELINRGREIAGV